MFKSKKILLFIILTFCSTFQIFSNIEDARTAYKNGNSRESLNLYNQWLNRNPDSNDFYKVLIEISKNKGDIFLITEILEQHIDNVFDINNKKLLFVKIAQLYELTSNLNKAQLYYQKASLIFLDNIDYKLLLKSAELLLLQGDYFKAESQLKEVLINNTEKNISIHANILYVALSIINSDNINDYSFLSSEDPQSLYIAYLITKLNPELETTINLKNKIIKEFKASPEAALIQKKILEIPNILISLGLLNNSSDIDSNIIIKDTSVSIETHPYMIQAGSFRDEENAHYLKLDLKESGFDAIVEEQLINNINYYKVILYLLTEDNINQTMKELKKKGFEGFPIY